jgi:glyoxylase-like metal-dependent hydrolase (beta-lactamase superfamily II)
VTTHPLQVRFVGCGDAFGSGGRFQACILLHAPGHNGDVLVDCGASSLVALKQQREDPNQIGLVLVSHLHGDHLEQHAGRLAARRVILTHLSAELLARADELGWETASDGMTVDLPAVGP